MTNRNRQVVFAFTEGNENTLTSAVRGGKGSGLAEMAKLGVNVPPGFTVTTTVARAYGEHKKLPKRVAKQLNRGLLKLEAETGRVFGDAKRPLLVSVRSGSPVSMPGMMDTVLNVGMNPTTVAALAHEAGEDFAYDSYVRFLRQFGVTVLGITAEQFDSVKAASQQQLVTRFRKLIEKETGIPMIDSPLEQLGMAIFAVLGSWTSERAIAYRQAENIPHWWGTACNVQAMVFGNMGDDSCTGVVFSRCPKSGARRLYGEFLPNAQGEDIVSGTRIPLPIKQMGLWNRQLAEELAWNVWQLEQHFNDIVDVEFTVESGRLYILQCRSGKRSAKAAATFAVHQVWDEKWSREEALRRIPATDVVKLERPSFDPQALATFQKLASGIAAAPGVATGKVVFSSVEAVELAECGEKVILIRPDTSPEDLPGMLAAEAIVTNVGGETSHAAVVARELGKPSVVGCSNIEHVEKLETISVCGNTGVVARGAVPTVASKLTKEMRIFLSWGNKAVFSKPRIGFEFEEERLCLNTLLNDFYLVDKMAATASGSWALQVSGVRNKVHQRLAETMACYLTIAVAGELRYAKARSLAEKDAPDSLNELKRNYGLAFDSYRESSQRRIFGKLQSLSLEKQTRFFKLAKDVFEVPWGGDGYGGMRWATIAAAPLAFLEGKLSHSVFVDHAFDLQHNGGRMFDKHRMFSNRTLEATMREQLDAKKHCTGGVKILHTTLTRIYNTVGDEVNDLYITGQEQGVW